MKKIKNGRVTFLRIFNRDGSQSNKVEIVDVENKYSLGIFDIGKYTQCIVTNPADMPEVKNIYKESFDILENSK